MTHSHDTPTPAMSAETVPSEEFVLVPREPTHEMKEAGARENQGMYPIAIYRAMIAAAPAPTPSSAAKGGEAKAKAKQALYSLRFEGQPMSSMFSAEELGLIVDTVSAALSTPTEGPASQTGPDVEPGQGSWAKRRAQMEASQTEGMGGDADKRAAIDRWVKIEGALEDVLHVARNLLESPATKRLQANLRERIELASEAMSAPEPNTAWMRPAALTPPETAEAVPVASYQKNKVGSDTLFWWSLAVRDGVPNNGPLYAHPDPEAARLREELERVTRELEEETALRVSAIDRMKDAERERDEAVKALESVTEELGLFRDFVINNATVWTLGSNHHHPIWARVADRLEGYTSPRDGEKWHLVRSALATETSR